MVRFGGLILLHLTYAGSKCKGCYATALPLDAVDYETTVWYDHTRYGARRNQCYLHHIIMCINIKMHALIEIQTLSPVRR